MIIDFDAEGRATNAAQKIYPRPHINGRAKYPYGRDLLFFYPLTKP